MFAAPSLRFPAWSCRIHIAQGTLGARTSVNLDVSSARMDQVGMWKGPGARFLNKTKACARRSSRLSCLLPDRPRAAAPKVTFESKPTPKLWSGATSSMSLP